MPNDLPPWHAVHQQTRRWLTVDVFTTIIADLRTLIRLGEGKFAWSGAVILDSRTLQSSLESGSRTGYDGDERKRGSTVQLSVDTLGQLLEIHVTSAKAQDRAQNRPRSHKWLS